MALWRIAVVPLLLVAWPLAAQTEPDSLGSAGKTSGLCFRGRPVPRCRAFLITELALVPPAPTGVDRSARIDWELGVLLNVGRKSAVGATLLLGSSDSYRRTGINARYRRWLTRRLSFEVGAGLVRKCELAGPEGCGDRAQWGPTAQGTINLSDLVAVSAAWEHLGAARGGDPWGGTWSMPPQSRTYAGVRFGSYAAPIAALALGVLVAATWN